MDAPKVVEQIEVVSRLQDDINLAFSTIEEFLPQIGHSEAKRLFLAATKYPCEHSDFSGESEAMIRLYSASKNVKDALVAMGVEVVITQIIENQRAGEAQGNVPVLDSSITPEVLEAGAEQALDDVGRISNTKAAPKKRTKKES